MQYTWKIKLHLNSGQIIHGLYECGHQNSAEVGKELLSGNDHTYNAMLNSDGTGQLFFRLRDVSVMEIIPAK